MTSSTDRLVCTVGSTTPVTAGTGATAPAYGAAAGTPDGDHSCVSISASANDNWCALTCAIPAQCPITMCKCGVKAEASPSPDAAPARSAVSLLAQDAPTAVVSPAPGRSFGDFFQSALSCQHLRAQFITLGKFVGFGIVLLVSHN